MDDEQESRVVVLDIRPVVDGVGDGARDDVGDAVLAEPDDEGEPRVCVAGPATPAQRGQGGNRRRRGGVRVRGGRDAPACSRGGRPHAAGRAPHPPHLDQDAMRALELFFKEQSMRDDFVDIVAEKLRSGEYVATKKTESRCSSVVWTTFREIRDARSKLRVMANVCSLCSFILRAQGDASTTTMKRHQQLRCSSTTGTGEGGGEASSSSGSAAPAPARIKRRPPVPPGAKQVATRLATEACSEAMLSFEAVCGGPIRDLCQGMIDVGSQYGAVDVKDLMPCPTTLSNHVKKEANAIRKAETIPLVKDAIAAEACAATVDEWTEEMTKRRFLSFVVHIVLKWGMEVEYLITIHYDEDDATGANIRKALLQALLELGITEEEVAKITFVSDNGANIVKALEPFKRHYCICHGINICVQTSMDLKYHDLVRRCLAASQQAWKVVQGCDEAVRLVKDSKGTHRVLKTMVQKSKRQHHSYSQMLRSVRGCFHEVVTFLTSKGKEHLLEGVTIDQIDEILLFLAPLDYDAQRESSSEVSLKAWPALLQHAQVQGGSPIVSEMRVALERELELLKIVQQVDLCKKLVKYSKQSNLSSRLSKTLKQEVEVRWNSTRTMLQSVDDSWDEIVTLLGDEQKARIQGIDRRMVRMLVSFLAPFAEESTKLEGEDYPTLPLCLLATYRLKKHCDLPVRPDETDVDADVGMRDEPEPECFALLRRNIKRHLEETIQLTTDHKIATVLHPRFKRLSMLSPEEKSEVLGALRERAAAVFPQLEIAEDIQPPQKKSKLDADYGDWSCDSLTDDGFPSSPTEQLNSSVAAAEEVERYLREAKPTTSENLLHWWETEGAVYPRLQAVAARLLAIPASSASSERVFSKAGFIMNPRRTNLAPASLDALIFLQQHKKKQRNKAKPTD